MLISTAVYWRQLFTKDYHPSPVDPMPIAQLTNEQVDSLRNVLEVFKDFDFIIRFEEHDFTAHPFFDGGVDFTWRRATVPSLRYTLDISSISTLSISIRFYRHENRAIEEFYSMVNRHYIQERRFTHINNPNNTEAILYDAYMDRAGHIWPTNTRFLVTQIRIGDAFIRLMESPHVRHLDRNLSNEFIQLLSELLLDMHETGGVSPMPSG